MRDICTVWLYILLSVYHTAVICREERGREVDVFLHNANEHHSQVSILIWFLEKPFSYPEYTDHFLSFTFHLSLVPKQCLKMQVGNNFSPEATKNTKDIRAMKMSAYSWKTGLKTYNWHILGGFFCVYIDLYIISEKIIQKVHVIMIFCSNYPIWIASF